MYTSFYSKIVEKKDNRILIKVRQIRRISVACVGIIAIFFFVVPSELIDWPAVRVIGALTAGIIIGLTKLDLWLFGRALKKELPGETELIEHKDGINELRIKKY